MYMVLLPPPPPAPSANPLLLTASSPLSLRVRQLSPPPLPSQPPSAAPFPPQRPPSPEAVVTATISPGSSAFSLPAHPLNFEANAGPLSPPISPPQSYN